MAFLRLELEAYIDDEFNPDNFPELGDEPTNDEMFAAQVKKIREEMKFEDIVAFIIENPTTRMKVKYLLIGNEGEPRKEEVIE